MSHVSVISGHVSGHAPSTSRWRGSSQSSAASNASIRGGESGGGGGGRAAEGTGGCPEGAAGPAEGGCPAGAGAGRMNVWWPNTPVPETEGGKFAGFGFVGAKARWVGVGAKARWGPRTYTFPFLPAAFAAPTAASFAARFAACDDRVAFFRKGTAKTRPRGFFRSEVVRSGLVAGKLLRSGLATSARCPQNGGVRAKCKGAVQANGFEGMVSNKSQLPQRRPSAGHLGSEGGPKGVQRGSEGSRPAPFVGELFGFRSLFRSPSFAPRRRASLPPPPHARAPPPAPPGTHTQLAI
eukprot:1189428-Prorocentrum_minimum.AAC.1